MKQLVILLLLPFSLVAQTHQGAIVYERKTDLHRRLQDEQMKAMVPQFQTADFQLVFSDSIAVFKAVPKEEGPDPFENTNGGGMHMNIRFSGPGDNGVAYKNYSSGKALEETMLADKKYIITDSLKQPSWKLSEDTATLLGHLCKKATTTTPRGSKVLAWYTNDIPTPVGPEQFFGLPGAILKVDVEEGLVVYSAKEIQPKADSRDLKAPTGGRLITRADFMKKMDEVMGPPDAQGRRIMRN